MSPRVETLQGLEITPNTVHASPQDWREQFIYFLLVDRFDDNRTHTPAFDPAAKPTGRRLEDGRLFQGGTLQGITRRLDYIRHLGCTAIWLSPIFKNRQNSPDSYHGYGIQDFLEVDPRYGTKEDLLELVQTAHAKGLQVILDIVINHTGDNWAYPQDEPYYYCKEAPGPFPFGFWRQADPAGGLQADDAVWPRELQSPDAYKRRGQIRHWSDPAEAVDGDFLSLKELDVQRPEVLSALIQIYKYWIGFADIDGFRVDTVKHMEDSAIAIFCNAMREYARRIGKRQFFIFGEIVGDDATLQRYLGRNARIEGTDERFPSLDACLDFPLYFILEETIKGLIGPDALRARYEQFKHAYADHGEAGRYFVTFVDNHDQMSRPYRRFMHSNHGNPEQMVLAMGYLLTSTGIPCIYYGSEQGFDGGGPHDAYVRECMFGGLWGAFDTTGVHYFDELNPIYQGIARIASIRREEPALKFGRQYFREVSGDGQHFGPPVDGQCTLAYSRILDTDEVVMALNLSETHRQDAVTVDRHLTPPGSRLENRLAPGRDYVVQEAAGRAYVRIPLGRHQMAILKKK